MSQTVHHLRLPLQLIKKKRRIIPWPSEKKKKKEWLSMPPWRFSGRTRQNALKIEPENRSWAGYVKTLTDLLLLSQIPMDGHGVLIIYKHPTAVPAASAMSQERQQSVSHPESPTTYKSQPTSSHRTPSAAALQKDSRRQQRTEGRTRQPLNRWRKPWNLPD